MDCRTSLFFALGLVGGAVGCVPQNSMQTVPPSPPVAEKAKETPPHAPKHAETCVTLGNFFAAEGSSAPRGSAKQEHLYDQARREYLQALDIDANCLLAYRALGRLYTTLGDHERAVATYQKALQKHPKEAVLWCDLGMCLARHKDWDHALDSLRRAADLEPENRQYQNMLGYCLAWAGHTDEALNVFRTNGGDGLAHYNLARVLLDTHHEAEARQHLQAAVQASPPCEAAQRLLAQLDAGTPVNLAVTPAALDRARRRTRRHSLEDETARRHGRGEWNCPPAPPSCVSC